MKNAFFTFTCLAVAGFTAVARGQAPTTVPSVTYEDGADGVKYRVTRQVVQRSIPSTEYQAREQKVYRPQITTEYQSYQQTYLTPVTQYQYVPHLRNWWNPFTGAYWTHDLQPVTTWQAQPATVQIPVARTTWVEATQTTQVPVTTYRTVAVDNTWKEPVGIAATGGSAVAATTPAPATTSGSGQLIGGQQYQSDPPRTASQWSTSTPTDAYKR